MKMKRKRKTLILLAALLSTAPLLAQYSPCYEAAFAEGQRLFKNGRYAEAKNYFKEAKNCPDPNEAEVDDMIGKCNREIKRKNELAEGLKREQEAAQSAYMNILKVEFGNMIEIEIEKEIKAFLIDEFGSELYSSDMRFLEPRIKYNGKLDDEDRTVTVDVNIIKPDRSLMKGTNSPKDYTYSYTFTVYSGYNRTKEISGWGNKDKSTYPAGTYGFELWHDGNRFFKTTFTIKPDSENHKYDKLPSSEQIKKKAENRNSIANQYYNKEEYAKAVEWHRKAAELGLADAQNSLGVMCTGGKGMEKKDYGEALKWYRKAANQSHNWGEYNMGKVYEYGQGVNIDYKKAMDWYQKALNHGDGNEKLKGRAKERLEIVKRLEKERQKELEAEKKRKEEADRKEWEESRIASLKARPWEFRVGFGLAYEMRGFNPGNLPVNDKPYGVGFGIDLNLFFAARKHLGASDFFIAPSLAASIGHSTLPQYGVSTTLESSNLTISYLDDYVFPHVSLGKDLKHGDISMGAGYYMDFMYRTRCKGAYSHEVALSSHYTGGWAGVIAYYGDVLGVRALVGFPKAIDCMVEGYNCQIKAPVVILSFNLLGDWQ